MTVKINRPVLRYFGGKWRLAQWIISHFPPHTTYVEPFCGAASVFLRKTPVEIEILNDIDGELINFFSALRNNTNHLIKAIISTPYSREEYDLAWTPATDSLERARRYYIRIWQGWGGSKGTTKYSWRIQHTNKRGKSVIADWTDTTALWPIAERLKQAFIEHDDALEVIDRFDQPHTLYYLDPPYLKETRTVRWSNNSYPHEIDRAYHQQLLDRMNALQGMAIISGYPSPLYDQALEGWQKATRKARTTNTRATVTESIWI